MDMLHKKLCEVSKGYRQWHENSAYVAYHWAIFAAFALFVSYGLLSNINTAYSDVGGNVAMPVLSQGSQVVQASQASSVGQLHRSARASAVLGEAQDHVLVKFKNGVSDSDKADTLSKHGLTQQGEVTQIGMKLISVPDDMTPEEVIQDLLATDGSKLDYAVPDLQFGPEFIPNDPSFSSEWHLAAINAPAAWDTTQGSPSVIIAGLDSGVDCTHPDLAAHCVAGWDTYDNNSNTADVYGHGTWTAGTFAEIGNNGIGGSGVAPQVMIMPIRVTDTSGNAYLSTIASGLTWAADHGARVANISFQVTGYSQIDSAAQYFESKGGVVTVAAGNYSTVDTNPNDPYVITVDATEPGNGIASFSNTGSDIDLAAPGDQIFVPTPGGGYGSGWGTSFSAPIVAGVAALVISANPSLTSNQVVSILYQNADDLGAPGWDPLYGYGLVDANKAVLAAGKPIVDTTPPTLPTNLTATAANNQVVLKWTASTDNVGVAGYRISRNGSVLTNVTATSYVDAAVTPNTTYTYSVQAYDAAGNISAASAPATVTVPVPTVTVTSFNVTSKTGTSATIAWTTNLSSTGVVSYGSSRTALNLSASDVATGTSHTVTISGLKTKSTYYYQISAVAADGSSSYKTAVSNFKTAAR